MLVTLIHNRHAGTDDQPGGDYILDLIRREGHEVTCHPTKGGDWAKVLDEPVDLIAIAGGDGTVGKVARKMIGKSTPMTVLPLGTANNISRAFHMQNKEIEDLIRGWKTASEVVFDVGEVTGPWGTSHFIEGMGVGLVANMMLKLNAINNRPLEHIDEKLEKVAFTRKLFADELLQSKSKHLKVNIDGKDKTGKYILTGVLNIQHIGPNLHLAPYADPSDGQLDIVFLPESKREEMSEYLLREAKNATPPDLDFQKCRHAEIELDKDAMHLDDKVCSHPFEEYGDEPAKLDIRILEQALHFRLPVTTREQAPG